MPAITWGRSFGLDSMPNLDALDARDASDDVDALDDSADGCDDRSYELAGRSSGHAPGGSSESEADVQES